MQLGKLWVAGIEADWAWADQTTTQGGFKYYLGGPGIPPDSTLAIKSGWDASLRGRLGILLPDDRAGRVAPGFYADLIAVAGDPLNDITDLTIAHPGWISFRSR